MGFLSTAIHWPLGLESGNEPDDNGGNMLVANGSPGFRKGVYGTARDFEATSANQYFELADNAAVSTGDIDFTVSCLLQFESLPASIMIILSKYHANTTSLREFMLHWNNTANRIRWTVTNGTTTGNCDANNLGLPVVDTPYRVIAWHDSVNDQTGIEVNGIAETPTSYSAGSQDTAEAFRVGARNATAGIANFFDGWIQDVWFDKRVWTAGERAAVARGLDPRLLP